MSYDLATGTVPIRQQVIDHVRSAVAGIVGVSEARYRLPGIDQVRRPVRLSECPLGYVYDGPDDEDYAIDEQYDAKRVCRLPLSIALVDTFDPDATDSAADNLLRKGNRFISVLLHALSYSALDWPTAGLQVDDTQPSAAFMAELASDEGPLLIAGVRLRVDYWVSLDSPYAQ